MLLGKKDTEKGFKILKNINFWFWLKYHTKNQCPCDWCTIWRAEYKIEKE